MRPNADTAFASFEEKWLQANPEQATVAVFLPADRRRRANAFGCLVHELEQAAFGAEVPAAAIKLQWWRQELGDAAAGCARHPIARELFDEHVRSVDPTLWPALVDGALAQVEKGTASSLRALEAELAVFYRPVALLDLALAGCEAALAGVNSRLWTGSLLLRGAAQPWNARMVPMDLLARHGLTRADLEHSGPQRSAMLRDLLTRVGVELERALADASGTALGRRVRARLDLDRARRAARAADPAAALQVNRNLRPWYALWVSWSEARRRGP